MKLTIRELMPGKYSVITPVVKNETEYFLYYFASIMVLSGHLCTFGDLCSPVSFDFGYVLPLLLQANVVSP